MRLPISNGGLLLAALFLAMWVIAGGVGIEFGVLWIVLAAPFLLVLAYAKFADSSPRRRR